MKRLIGLVLMGLGFLTCGRETQFFSLKQECLETLYILSNTLVDLQIKEKEDPNFGAIRCPCCDVLHTRASEAVYPFIIAYENSGDEKYLKAAINTGNWLIEQQQPGGEWLETPEDWTGTTADQLLMMALAFPIIDEHLSGTERDAWKVTILKAADYLVRVMSPDFASINYCPTTAAALAMTHEIIPDERYTQKAKNLARWVVAKMDEDGFITGEAARVYGVKYGVDLGYEMDMSLWGLALYANGLNDAFVDEHVRRSLRKNLYFVYPNGAVDGSWGTRSYKWTTYGSKTADGCQILFSLYTSEDARYRTAAMRNLNYLRGIIRDGMIGYGPHYWDLFDTPPCIYPTFVRAKNLAMAVEFGEQEAGEMPPLPTDLAGWAKHYPTVDVALARSFNFMATVSAYGYRDALNSGLGKYTHRPGGGSICNLWVRNHGFLQTSSQTKYVRGEPMHMPVIEDSIICLTPRIEFVNENGYFTNLYECSGHLSVRQEGLSKVVISTSGELKDETYLQGGVAYVWRHIIHDDAIEKIVELRFHGRLPEVQIVEPIVERRGMRFERLDSGSVLIQGEERTFKFEIMEGEAMIELGKDESLNWYPFPSIKCYPIVLTVRAPEDPGKKTIRYRISIVD